MRATRFLSLLFAALLLFTAAASAEARIPVYRVDGALLFFDKSTGEITGFAGEPTRLTLPAYIGGYRVISVGKGAFAGCTTLKSLAIENGITAIGENAFYGCTSLSEVTFNGEIDNIALNAFDSTPWSVGGSGFVIAGRTLLLRYNGSEENIYVPSGVKRIAPNAFAYNTAVKTVVLPEGLVEIGDNAFVHCYSLADIHLPSTLSSIGLGAFDDTIWLRRQSEDFVSVNGILVAYNGADSYVSVPDTIRSIGSGAFMSNERITAVYLPEGIVSIGEAAFGSMPSLTAVSLPNSLEMIDDYAFVGSGSVALFAPRGSYAEYYSTLNGIPFSGPISVSVNGNGIYLDAAPLIIGGSAYVPMRAVLESMGLSVYWNDALQEVSVSGNGAAVTASVGSTTAIVNGEAKSLTAPPVMLGGRVLIPARGFAELFGFGVSWNDALRSVAIEK